MISPKPRRPFGVGAYIAIMGLTLLVAMASGIAVALLETLVGVSGFWVNAVILLVAMAVATALCIWWWRGIDEAAREAHKWAWWWGGTGGMAVGAIVVLSLQLGEDVPITATNLSAGDLIAGGMMAILLFQLVGYSIAWAAWWLRHR
ncbi:hypothetical protein [Brevundimonas sp.]|uniref:hypothetical protein n=1 Tax=Brevundimonas sp. TaxID=1871086 RepID=UPI0035684D5E